MSITRCEQDVDSAVGTGANDYEVGYAYAKVASTGRNTIRRTGLTQRYASTDKLSLTYEYLSTGNSLDDAASRLSRVKVSTTVVALYKYMGDGTVVNTAYPDIDVFKPVNTSITGVYRMDNFNRITDDRWVKDLDTDQQFVELDIAYDRNSNIVGVEDQILGGGTGFDVHYDIDDLDRLTFADEGNLSAGAIAGGTRTRKGNWTLSQTGNWHGNLRDLDGDGAYDDVGDEDLTAFTYNVANEWTARTITIGTGGGTSTTAYTRTHDAVGNLIDDGEDYEYVYDPFGRLKEVRKTSNQSLVAEYRYNGLGFRVGWHYDVDADGTVESTSDDPWFFFAYDEGWRVVATYRSTDSSPKEQFVHHMAGLGGYGGSSYIDAVILRERDADTTWAEAADGVLEERLYYCQNWRADVVAMVSSAGKLIERVRYSAYGIPTAFPAGDTNSDGDWDASDSTDIGSNYTPGSTYAVLRDTDLDGDVDANDVTHANSITGGYQTLGKDTLTSAAVRNRIAYAGYQYDPAFTGLGRHLYHVRHRVYDAELGRWTRRDPLGYVDGMGLYEYVMSQPLALADAMGLASVVHPGTPGAIALCALASEPLVKQIGALCLLGLSARLIAELLDIAEECVDCTRALRPSPPSIRNPPQLPPTRPPPPRTDPPRTPPTAPRPVPPECHPFPIPRVIPRVIPIDIAPPIPRSDPERDNCAYLFGAALVACGSVEQPCSGMDGCSTLLARGAQWLRCGLAVSAYQARCGSGLPGGIPSSDSFLEAAICEALAAAKGCK